MEKLPKFEKKEEGEINEEELIEFMKEREPGDEEAVEMLKKWIDQEQEKTEDYIGFNVKLAEVYEKAGWTEAANESFEAAAECAYQEGDEERSKELTSRIKKEEE